VSCEIDRKSTSSTCHFLGSSLVCWSSRKKSSVAQSTTEVEYVLVAGYCSQILWIMHTMRDYGETYKSVPLICDSCSAICLAQNLVFHGRAKHIKVRHHFLRDHVKKGDVEMKYIDTERQLADIFTKLLDATHFASLRENLVFAIPTTWFDGELVFCLVSTLSYILLLFCCIFFIFT
jgi:hypothetical protein